MTTQYQQISDAIGPRPLTSDQDTVICSQCLTVYEAPGFYFCQRCYNAGHKEMIRNADEWAWWVRYYDYRIANRLAPNEAMIEVDRTFMNSAKKAEKTLRKKVTQ